jgi:hypothetical protein
VSKRIAPTLTRWFDERLPWTQEDWKPARAELRALLAVARAADGIMWHDCHALARCPKCSRLDRALSRLDKVSK